MSKNTKLGLIICLLLPILFAIPSIGGPDKFATILGLCYLISFVLNIIIGIILVLIRSTREFGQGMLIAAGLGLLIGFSLCTIAPIKFH